MHYTASVKHTSSISFACTIIVAVIAGFFIVQKQTATRIEHLLASPAITDQLAGISLAKQVPFTSLVALLRPILEKHTDASVAAQQLLVRAAFAEHRLQELETLAIDKDLLNSAKWWETNPKRKPRHEIKTETPIATSLNFLAWYVDFEAPPPLDTLVELPIRDRDGSVLLAVLAIEKFATREQLRVISEHWILDYDVDRKKAAILFAALLRRENKFPHVQNSELFTLQSICEDANFSLAWRTLHNADGTINPDIALAGMISNQEKFFPILVETAKENTWKHPEHPIAIAMRFAPEIAERIPIDLLKNDESRTKWWALFTCGLLLEGR